jgi:site-specific DNA-methyltransferase (adenine-specific)
MSAPTLTTILADIRTSQLSLIPDDSVDLALFSPPYKRKDGYTLALLAALGATLSRVMKPAAHIFMNFGQLREDFDRPFEARAALKVGGALHTTQTIIWAKSIAVPNDRGALVQRGHYQPINSEHLLNYGYEFIFGFVKGENSSKLDRRSIGVPFADKSNLTRGSRGKHGDIHCRGDVWFVPHSTTGPNLKKHHAHSFPFDLADMLIAISGIKEGATVLDPFLGGGTSVIAAKLRGMNSIGVDNSQKAVNMATSRWAVA